MAGYDTWIQNLAWYEISTNKKNDTMAIGWNGCQDFKCMRLAERWVPGKNDACVHVVLPGTRWHIKCFFFFFIQHYCWTGGKINCNGVLGATYMYRPSVGPGTEPKWVFFFWGGGAPWSPKPFWNCEVTTIVGFTRIAVTLSFTRGLLTLS